MPTTTTRSKFGARVRGLPWATTAGESALPRSDVHAPKLSSPPEARLRLLAGGLDLFIIAVSFVAAHWIRDSALTRDALATVLAAGTAAGLAALFVFVPHGLYDLRVIATGWTHLSRLIRSWGLLAAVVILAIFVMKPDPPLRSRLALGLFLALGFAAIATIRLGLWRTLVLARWEDALRGGRVIVGSGMLARRIASATSDPHGWEPRLVGFVDDHDPTAEDESHLDAPFLGGLDVVERLAQDRRIDEVIVAREDLSRGDLVELAHAWMDRGLRVGLASSAFEVMVARASSRVVGDAPLAEFRRSPQFGIRLFAKRAFDVAAVTLGGILLLPLLAAIAVAVKLTSPGPVLYRQKRMGRGGKPFTMFKFRSMVAGNDDRRHRDYVQELMNGTGSRVDGDGQPVFKLVDDPRITPLGKLLRRSSLDELPQLWNVLIGEMSLVGPRPCLPYEWELYRPWQRRRLDAVPGITGLWQVAGRSRVSFEDMVLLDLHYIANWSLPGDLAILARTVPVVLDGRGGH